MSNSFLLACIGSSIVINMMILWCLTQIVRDISKISYAIEKLIGWLGSENFLTSVEVRKLKSMLKEEEAA